jgi:hypothetical protein
MAIADLISCSYKLISHGGDLIVGGHWGGDLNTRINGTLLQWSMVVSVWCVAGMTIEPYRIVIKLYGALTATTLRRILMVIWAIPLVIAICPLFFGGGNAYEYVPSGMYVTVKMREEYMLPFQLFSMFNFIGITAVPIVVYSMFSWIKRRLAKIEYHSFRLYERGLMLQKAVTKRGRVLILAHLFTWWSFTVVAMVFHSREVPLELDAIAYLVALLGTSINPLVCFYLEPKIRV